MEEKDLDIKIEAIIDELAEGVIERARRNLAVTRTRTGYCTKNGVTTPYKYKSKVDSSGRFVRTNTEEAKRQIAFLIDRKIGKYGTEPVHYFKEAIEAEMESNWEKYNEEIK
jgi:hypothetical protein